MKWNSIYIVLFFVITFAACNKDDVYPVVQKEILTAQTNAEGAIMNLITDKGQLLKAENGYKIKGLDPDSYYRALCTYQIRENSEEATAFLYYFKLIISSLPMPEDYFEDGIKTDPVFVQSVWRSGDYINLSILVKNVYIEDHTFSFVENSIETQQDIQTLFLTLYHDRGYDLEGATETLYLSVPLDKYKNLLFPGDSVKFSINTYKEGLKVYSLPY